jgi:hypothetical protein
MIKIIRSLLIVLFLASFSLQANSETSWITKKDKTKKTLVKKTETKDKKSEWIKKKKKEEVKKNKKKFKEKIKESKSWITKKSKEKTNDIKENLKKYKSIDNLPKAEFYFAAVIEPKDNEKATYLYGYVNSDENSKKFKHNNKSFYSISDGIAFLEDGKTTCKVDSQTGNFLGDLMGKVVVKCINKIEMAGTFIQIGDTGKGIEGETNKGNNIEFEFYQTKKGAITQLALYKSNIENTILVGLTPNPGTEVELKPAGKYYALVIGNSKYTKWASLKSPVNDVIEIKNVLEKQYSFEKVIPVINGTRKDIFKAITELTKITTDKDYVLIYYSGHGDIRSTQSYWIPVDGAKDFDPTEWINIRDIEVYLENEISAHHLVVMVDSCYFAVASKGNTEIDDKNKTMAYSKLLDRRARIILSSGSNEPVEDSVNKHSKFASSFIQSLKNNESTIRLSEITENIFIDHAGSRQQPYHARVMAWGHGGGDFIFIKK